MKARTLAGLLIMTVCLAACAGKPAPAPLGVGEAESLVRDFYGQLAAYDLLGMRAASTPEFEIIENDGTKAMRMNWETFASPARSRPVWC